jgi:transposase
MSSRKHIPFNEKKKAVKSHLEEGIKVPTIAKVLGVTERTVYNWIKIYKETGDFESLRRRRGGGPPRILDEKITTKLLDLLLQPATEFGFDDPLWTTRRVTLLVKEKFGLDISKMTAWRFLRRNNLRYKKPEKNYQEGSKDELNEWLKNEFPRILQEVRNKRGILYFMDESNIQLSSVRGKTWAPVGVRPTIEVSGQRGSISAISAISKSGYLVFRLHNGRIKSDEVIEFFRELLDHHPRRHLFVCLDNAPVHTSKKIKQFESENKRLHIEFLPRYWPRYNPDEFVWNYLKNNEMPVYSVKNKGELEEKLIDKLCKMRDNVKLLKAIFCRCPLNNYMV